MIVIDTTVLIDRPPDACFEFVASDFFLHLKRWDPAVVELKKLTDGPVGQGTRGRLEQLVKGKRYGRTFEVIEFEPDRRFAVRNVEPEGPERHALARYTFTAEGDGACRVDHHFELQWTTLLFRLARPLVRSGLEKELAMSIGRRLKAAVEEIAEPSGVMAGPQPRVVKPTRGPARS
jgi:uncharacterized protein YndB with AHSA1/START domain